MSNEVLVSGEDLKAFTAEVFTGAGLAPEDAEIEADVLVWANLRGVDSHGVLRIPWYMSHVDNGVMKTQTQYPGHERDGRDHPHRCRSGLRASSHYDGHAPGD